MPIKRSFNAELRSFILQHAIRQEALTSEILKFIFRILKNDTKTLDNTSSSLSFKNKIDLLLDLGDIEKKDHSHFIKLMEIRNQFAHNPKCTSFVALNNINSDYTKFLKNFKNDEKKPEESLCVSYIFLFKHCHKILCQIKRSYQLGFLTELQRYQCYELLNNRFNDWITQTKQDFEGFWQKGKHTTETLASFKIEFFIMTLEAYKYKMFADISKDVIENALYNQIFANKKITAESKFLLNKRE